jgi:hypothetical protein
MTLDDSEFTHLQQGHMELNTKTLFSIASYGTSLLLLLLLLLFCTASEGGRYHYMFVWVFP